MIQFEEALFDDYQSIPESSCEYIGDKGLEYIFDFYDQFNADTYHMSSRDDICTPMSCVKLMLDYIPDGFWNKEVSVLDPCCGNGNFGAYCMFKTSINNIHFNELSPIRYNNCKKLLNPNNITNCDFFEIYGDFDLIMMNPPYSGGGNKNQSFSNKFIEHAISLLKKGGYLCVVSPNNWMTYNNNNTTLKKLLRLGSFLVINNDIKKYFSGVGSSFTVFVWQKGVFDNETNVINGYLVKDTQKVNIPKDIDFLPLYLSNDVLDIISKSMGDENGITYRCDLHNFTQKNKLRDQMDDEFCYKTIHTPNKIRYSPIKQNIYDMWNVLIPTSTYFKPFVENNVNVTQCMAYVSFKSQDEANEELKKLNQDYIRLIVHLTRYGNFNNMLVLKHLKLDGVEFEKNEQDVIDNLVRLI